MKSICLTVFLFCTISIHAQMSKMWGKVTQSDRLMTHYEQDSTAEAVVLFDYGEMDISYETGNYNLEHYRRIKILKESALDRGNISIPYLSYEGREGVQKVEAQIILPNNEVIKVEDKDVFKEKISEYWSSINFAIPNMQVGAVIEYRYKFFGDNIVQPREWYFQYDIPVKHSLLEVNFSELLGYMYLFQGAEYLEKQEDGTYLFNGVANVSLETGRYEMKDVPAFKDEAYITCEEDYRGRIRFQLLEVYGKSMDRGTEDYYIQQKILSSWDEIAKKMVLHENFGGQYKKKRNFKQLQAEIAPLTATAPTEKDKAKAIYNYLNENIEWDGYDGIFSDEKLDKIYEERKADRAELNLMLVALLRSIGIEAEPVLTSTRSHGKLLTQHPIFDQFNYMLVRAKLDGKYLLIDMGNKMRPMGYPAVKALNYKGWVIHDDYSHEWIDLNMELTQNIIAFSGQIENGKLVGKLRTRANGYEGVNNRTAYSNEREGQYWEERLTNYVGVAAISDFKVENYEDTEKWFQNEFDVALEEQVLDNDDYLYISPVVYSDIKENPFKSERRYYPIDYPYQFSDQYVFELAIPAGYEVDQLPEAVRFILPSKGGEFKFSASEVNGKIQLHSRFKLTQVRFQPYEYEHIKTLYDLIIEKQSEQIVLRKSEG